MTDETQTEKTRNKDDHQVVYVMPAQDVDDEIDFWQLILPLVKYKIQILLFLLAGFIFGLGFSWYQNREKSIAALTPKIDYAQELKKAEGKLETSKSMLFDTIDQIQENIQLLEITGAEYYYPSKNLKERITFNLEAFQWFNPPFVQNKYGMNLTVKLTSTSELKHALKTNYTKIEKINQQISILDFERKKNLVKLNLSETEESQKFREVENELKKLQHQYHQTLFRIRLIQHSLADRLYFDIDHNKIPLNIWSDLVQQSRVGLKDSLTPEFQQIQKIRQLEKEMMSAREDVDKFQMILYLTQNTVHLTAESYNWPSVLALADSIKIQPKPKSTQLKISKKILLSGVLLSFFLGVASVFLRVFIRRAHKIEDYDNKKNELKNALKYWKL